MFDVSSGSVAPLIAVRDGLGELCQDVDDATRVDRLRVLEEIKSAAAAAQAREVAALAASQKAEQLAQGVPAERAERGIAGQIGLAVKKSPWYAARYLGWCRILTTELPHTYAALRAGRVNEPRAMIVARETIWLSREDRATVDEELASDLERLGDKKLEAAAKRIAYRLDPAGYVARSAAAANDRCVTLRPAPDVMGRLTGLLPIPQAVACYASLSRAADLTISGGDQRGRGQIMADTMVERITGQTTAPSVPVEISLVMTDTALLRPSADGGSEPALLEGAHPIPAEIARALVFDAPEEAQIWLRRLYTSPDGKQLVAMDSKRREWTAGQRRFVRTRDQVCRTPWCDAPVRHIDHVNPADFGGPTEVDNAQGYCAACNYAKQAPGWRNKVITPRDGPHEVEITTPTGHTYRSRAPDPPRAA